MLWHSCRLKLFPCSDKLSCHPPVGASICKTPALCQGFEGYPVHYLALPCFCQGGLSCFSQVWISREVKGLLISLLI